MSGNDKSKKSKICDIYSYSTLVEDLNLEDMDDVTIIDDSKSKDDVSIGNVQCKQDENFKSIKWKLEKTETDEKNNISYRFANKLIGCTVLRYVSLPNACTNERLIQLLPSICHKLESLEEATLSLLEKLEMDVDKCRGQSYDNASNMSVIYSGL